MDWKRRLSRSGFAACAAFLIAMTVGCGAREAPQTTQIYPPPPGAEPAADLPGAPRFEAIPASDLPQYESAQGAVQAAESAEPYTADVGDILEISVYGDPDLTRDVPVRPDGMISFTFVGDVRAAGRSIEEIRGELKARLSEFLRTPEVTVIAKQFAAQRVFVGGEVRSPGVYQIAPGTNTLVDVVYLAGLTTEKADVGGAVLVRNGRLVPVDFGRLLQGDMASNVVLADRDLVHFPELAQRYVYVLGEVRSPSAVETRIPLTIVDVLAKSGGPIKPFAKLKQIAVLRGGLKQPTVAMVNYKRLVEGDFSQNIMVKPGDIIYVPPTGITTYTRFLEQVLRTFNLFFQAQVIQEGFD